MSIFEDQNLPKNQIIAKNKLKIRLKFLTLFWVAYVELSSIVNPILDFPDL